MTTKRKPGRPRKATPQNKQRGAYTIAQSTTGKWVVYLHGSVRYAADTEEKAQEYVSLLTEKAPD